MAGNSYRVKGSSSANQKSFFAFLERALKMDTLFEDGLPAKYIPHVLFLTFLGIFYIGSNHMAERTIREIDGLESEVEELRADFTSLKADQMFAAKQSEVARKVKVFGLKESYNPPNKIIVKKGEY
ncbi:MAG: FtsL-like putative cell division protein [Cyclobacteriaceae bacterium]